MENERYEKKSLKIFTVGKPDWKSLAKDCVGFSNGKGGQMIIGIEDNDELPPVDQTIPDGLIELIRKRISELTINVGVNLSVKSASNGSEFIELKIHSSFSSIASTTDGQYYIRISDHCKPVLPDELNRLFTDKPSFQWETKEAQKIFWQSSDGKKLSQFLSDIRHAERVSDFVQQKSDEELLHYYQLTNEHGNLTNLGILWIGKREHRAKLMFAPVIQFIKYNEKEQKVRKELWDDFSLTPKELIEEVWNKIPEWKDGIEISEGILGRRTIYHYHENIVRELLANALVHRPYTTRGDIFINLFPDRLEIHNPGLLPLGVTPQNILHQSVKRNEHLAKIFYDLGLMEREGSGYDKIYEIQASESKPMPVVEENYDRILVTVHNAIKNPDIILFIERLKRQYYLSQKEIICLGIIAQYQSLIATEFSRLIQSTSDKQIKNWLGNLMEYNIVKSKGKTKGTEYFLNPEILKNNDFSVNTSLKYITDYRLEALIFTDLERFGQSSISQIHQRIGQDIPHRKLRSVLYNMTKIGKLKISGNKRNREYFIDKR